MPPQARVPPPNLATCLTPALSPPAGVLPPPRSLGVLEKRDDAIQLAMDMSDTTWNAFKAELKDLTPDEISWRPLPQANNIAVLIHHLRVAEELFLVQLEQGERSPYTDAPSVQHLTDAVPLDDEQNLREFEAWHERFLHY